MKYHIEIQEIWVRAIEVEANSEAEAMILIDNDSHIISENFSYSHTEDIIINVR